MPASLSGPIIATSAEWAPSRAVPTAWLEPLPPGPMSKSEPSIVSPNTGSFGARMVSPTAKLPTMVISGRTRSLPESSRRQASLQKRPGGDLVQRLVIAIFAHALERRVLHRVIGRDIAPTIGAGAVGVGAVQQIAVEDQRVARLHPGIFVREAPQTGRA